MFIDNHQIIGWIFLAVVIIVASWFDTDDEVLP